MVRDSGRWMEAECRKDCERKRSRTSSGTPSCIRLSGQLRGLECHDRMIRGVELTPTQPPDKSVAICQQAAKEG